MPDNIIRNFFILITAIYTFYKLLNSRPKNNFIFTLLLISSLLASTIITYFCNNIPALNLLLLFTFFFLLIKFVEKNAFVPTLMTVLFSFALSYIIFSIAIIFISLLFLPFFYNNYNVSWFIIRFCIGFSQFFLIYTLFHIPRLRKGMIFLYHIPSGNTGSTICIILFMLIIIFCQIETISDFFMTLVFSVILILGFFLLYWWNYHITQTYRRFLRKNELDSLYLLLEERNREILTLKDENDYLAELIHKDNKLIPAITRAILESRENHIPLDLSQWKPIPLFFRI